MLLLLSSVPIIFFIISEEISTAILLTFVTESFFNESCKGRKYEISVRNYTFDKIYNNYSEIVNYKISEEKRKQERLGTTGKISGRTRAMD